MVARFVFHTNMLDGSVYTVSADSVDIFRTSLVERKAFSMSLILSEVAPEVVASQNLDRIMRRSFLNLQGMRALQQGANDFSSHHYVFPDPAALKQLVSENASGAPVRTRCEPDPASAASSLGIAAA